MSPKKRVQKLEQLVHKLHNPVAYPTPAPPLGSAQQEAPPPIASPNSALVIMAHPDDAEFLCAGTIAKWCAEGWEVRYVLVTGGDKSQDQPRKRSQPFPARSPSGGLALRRWHARLAADVATQLPSTQRSPNPRASSKETTRRCGGVLLR